MISSFHVIIFLAHGLHFCELRHRWRRSFWLAALTTTRGQVEQDSSELEFLKWNFLMPTNLTRRQALALPAGIALGSLVGRPAIAAEPVKIGLVAALSGPSAKSGEGITRGLEYRRAKPMSASGSKSQSFAPIKGGAAIPPAADFGF
jgi:hypothetical protein